MILLGSKDAMLVNMYCFLINQQVHSAQLWQVHRYMAVQAMLKKFLFKTLMTVHMH